MKHSINYFSNPNIKILHVNEPISKRNIKLPNCLLITFTRSRKNVTHLNKY